MQGTGRITTAVGEIALALARPADMEAVLAILDEAATWLTERGIQQWQPGAFPRQPLAESVARGEVFLAFRVAEPVGTVTIQWADPLIWPEAGEDAGYIHKLAIRRSVGGQRVGRALLRWAEDRIAASGKGIARLDCMGDNEALCAYYRRAGYVDLGECQIGRWRMRRFEKEV